MSVTVLVVISHKMHHDSVSCVIWVWLCVAAEEPHKKNKNDRDRDGAHVGGSQSSVV